MLRILLLCRYALSLDADGSKQLKFHLCNSNEEESLTAKRRHRSDAPNRKSLWFIGAGLTTAIALLVALTFAFSGPQAQESELGLANLAPDMTLATLDGEFRLSENQGDVLVLYFSFPG